MKKILSFLTAAASLLLILTACSGGEPAEENVVFTGIIEEVSDGDLLVSTEDDVGFDMARVHFSEDMEEPDFEPAVGQTGRLTILPQIAESYPVQVTAVKIELVADAAVLFLTGSDHSSVILRADGYTDGGSEFIANLALNAETLLLSSVRHLPVFTIDSPEALAQFLEEGGEYFQFDVAYGGNESFSENAARYDDAFFADKLLLIAYVQESSGSTGHEVSGVAAEDGVLTMTVRQDIPEMGTADMADWFILLELPRSAVEGCTGFDAYIE